MLFESHRDKSLYYSEKDNVCSVHFHKSTEIMYVISGEKRAVVSSREYLLRARDMLIVPPCEAHVFMPSDEGEQIVLTIPPKYCEQFAKICERATPTELVYHDSMGEILPLLRELATNKSEFFLLGALNLALARFSSAVSFTAKKTGGKKSKIEEIYCYIEENYKEDLTLEGVAKHFGYSKSHFSMLFKKNFNMGFTSYLNSTRITKSVKYLADKSIYEASILSGFKSPQQYHLNFKRIFGCSPREYLRLVGRVK